MGKTQLELIDLKIASIKKNLDIALEQKKELINSKKSYDVDSSLPWVINKDNVYYQLDTKCWSGEIRLIRNGKTYGIDLVYYTTNFRPATHLEVQQHIRFLASKGVTFDSGLKLIKIDIETETTSIDKKLVDIETRSFDTKTCEFYMTTVLVMVVV